jgi:hypothetical protein
MVVGAGPVSATSAEVHAPNKKNTTISSAKDWSCVSVPSRSSDAAGFSRCMSRTRTNQQPWSRAPWSGRSPWGQLW